MRTTIRAAILFNGGDASGMNPFLRAFTRLGLHRYDATVFGVKDGYLGLVRASQRALCNEEPPEKLVPKSPWRQNGADQQQDLVLLDGLSVSGLASRGGIVLGAARCEAFKERDVRRQVGEY